jgi:hypothetical protein
MPLMTPTRPGALLTESQPTAAAAGTTITANATINTKGTTPTQLIASTAADSFGIFVHIENNATSNTATNTLLDIMRGAGGSETVLIPDLMAGWVLSTLASNSRRTYFFPLFIPSGTRLSARSASVVTAKTCVVSLTLLQRPTQLGYVGTRVTAYGVTSAGSRGTDSTSGNSAYGTSVSLSASTANPIRFMQMGLDPATRATLTDQWTKCAIYAGTGVLVDDLPGSTDTGTESIGFNETNEILAQMQWNLPAGIDLKYASQHNTTAAAFSAIVYAVD